MVVVEAWLEAVVEAAVILVMADVESAKSCLAFAGCYSLRGMLLLAAPTLLS